MEISTTLNKKNYKELMTAVPNPLNIVFEIIMIILAVTLALAGYNTGSATYIVIALIFPFIVPVEVAIFRRRALKKTFQRIQESYGTDEIKENFFFGDEEITASNPASGAKLSYKYDVIKKFRQSKNLYLLITRQNQAIVVSKDNLKDGREAEFLKLVAEKMPQLKIK